MTDFRYSGSDDYITTDALESAVNAALTIERPLLIKGEPGTGKTRLAHSIAKSIGCPLLVWSIKSTSKAIDGLYEYDVVQRLNDSRFGEGQVSNIKNYIRYGKLGLALTAETPHVLLIDEIDKADIEFPNDLLFELDEMSFYIKETDKSVKAKNRPMVIITSNAEKELPDAFLRRCVFHFIDFPNRKKMEEIINVHHKNLARELLDYAINKFYYLRTFDDLKKKPSTSELIDWIHVLLKSGLPIETLKEEEIPFLGTLIKKERDLTSIREQGTRF